MDFSICDNMVGFPKYSHKYSNMKFFHTKIIIFTDEFFQNYYNCFVCFITKIMK